MSHEVLTWTPPVQTRTLTHIPTQQKLICPFLSGGEIEKTLPPSPPRKKPSPFLLPPLQTEWQARSHFNVKTKACLTD